MEYLKKYFDIEKFNIRMNEIDFEGQKLSQKLFRIILTTALIIAMIVSYLYQKLKYGTFILTGGFVLSLILCLPSWPIYNKHHLKWLSHETFEDSKKKKKN